MTRASEAQRAALAEIRRKFDQAVADIGRKALAEAVEYLLKESDAMPLKRGKSQKAISANIRELEHSQTKAGKKRTHKQNIAIAMKKAGKSRKKR